MNKIGLAVLWLAMLLVGCGGSLRGDANAGPNPGGGFYGGPNINVGRINPQVGWIRGEGPPTDRSLSPNEIGNRSRSGSASGTYTDRYSFTGAAQKMHRRPKARCSPCCKAFEEPGATQQLNAAVSIEEACVKALAFERAAK